MFYPFGATKHYGESIKDELTERGALVEGYDERPSQRAFMKVIIRLFKKKIPMIFLMYIKKIIKENESNQFDYIVILRGEAFTQAAMRLLREKYKNAVFILYLWDILQSTNVQEIIPEFDRVLSFDPDDVKNNAGLVFRPTFFMPCYSDVKKSIKKKYDVVFIGTVHSNRYQTLQEIKTYLDKNQISHFYYIYVPSIIMFIKHRFIDGIPIQLNDINFEPLTLPNALQLIAESRCILDLNFTGQKSLSMRAFEAMASKTKYITTNKEIMNYDFYNENNILILDIDNMNIPTEFINTEFKEISADIMNKYSVKSLVSDFFEGL